MNELIKVTEQNGQQLVSGRDLHEFLGIKTPYHMWIERNINNYGFIKDIEYTVMNKNVHNLKGGKQYIIDHALTLDMAKQISMVSKGEKSKQIRLYFIKCEEKLKEIIPQVQRKIVDEYSIDQKFELEKLRLQIELEKVKSNKIIEFPQQNTDNYISRDDVAKKLGLLTSSGNYHGKFIDSIAINILKLNVGKDNTTCNEYFKNVPTGNVGYPMVYYSEKAVKMIENEYNKLIPVKTNDKFNSYKLNSTNKNWNVYK